MEEPERSFAQQTAPNPTTEPAEPARRPVDEPDEQDDREESL